MKSIQSKTNVQLPRGFVFILAMLSSITPLAVDMYLPSFTQMSEFFYTSIDQIEITLAIFLIGYGIGQLIGGPLSDRYGRKLFILIGLGIYVTFSFFITIASSVEQLWVFRFFQAIGGGFAVVNTNAVVRDLFHGKEGARVFSIVSMIIMIAPMLAPALGTAVLHFFPWQFIFIFLSLYAISLAYFVTKLPETSPKVKDKKLFANYKRVLTSKKAVAIMLTNAFGFGGMFVFITKSSFLYMEYFSVDANMFTVLFGLNVFTLILFTRVNISLLKKYETFQILQVGIIIQLFAGLVLLVFSSYHVLFSVVAFMMLYIGVLGFIFANSISLLLEDFAKISATANALSGVIGFLVAGLMGFLASFFHDGTLIPIFAMMVSTSTIAFCILYFVLKKRYFKVQS